jgi:transcriptional regulator with XRE-family HTH domain
MTLRQLREARAQTQLEVAIACNVTPTTVSLWETGKTEPRPVYIRKLAEIYKVDIATIREAINESKSDQQQS